MTTLYFYLISNLTSFSVFNVVAQNSGSDFAYCGRFNQPVYEAGIYAWAAQPRLYSEMMDPYPSADFIIPGMKVGCLPYDALASSTLECFFSTVCLNSTSRWISSLPKSSWPKPLNSSSMIVFTPNTSVASILSHVLVDHWIQAKHFSGYYHVCKPIQCTYVVYKKPNIVYLITLLIGLYGGLTVALRIVAPILVQYKRSICCCFNRRALTSLPDQQGILMIVATSDKERLSGVYFA